MSSRRQRSIPLGGRYRQVSLYFIGTFTIVHLIQCQSSSPDACGYINYTDLLMNDSITTTRNHNTFVCDMPLDAKTRYNAVSWTWCGSFEKVDMCFRCQSMEVFLICPQWGLNSFANASVIQILVIHHASSIATVFVVCSHIWLPKHWYQKSVICTNTNDISAGNKSGDD